MNLQRRFDPSEPQPNLRDEYSWLLRCLNCDTLFSVVGKRTTPTRACTQCGENTYYPHLLWRVKDIPK